MMTPLPEDRPRNLAEAAKVLRGCGFHPFDLMALFAYPDGDFDVTKECAPFESGFSFGTSGAFVRVVSGIGEPPAQLPWWAHLVDLEGNGRWALIVWHSDVPELTQEVMERYGNWSRLQRRLLDLERQLDAEAGETRWRTYVDPIVRLIGLRTLASKAYWEYYRWLERAVE